MKSCDLNARPRRGRLSKCLGLAAAFALLGAACGNDETSEPGTTQRSDAGGTSSAPAPVETTAASVETSAPASVETTVAIGTSPASEGVETTAPATNAAPEVDLESLIERANDEGSVTLYTSQSIANSELLADAFMETYPEIEVTVVRDLDTNSLPRVDAERETGRGIADVVIAADQLWIKASDAQGYFVPLETGRLDTLGFDASELAASEHSFLVNAALFTFAWNTQRLPEGLDGYEGLLAPDLANGNIGIIPPTTPSRVAYYMHLRDTYGDEFLPALLAQDPHFYESYGQLRQGLISGEVAAAPYVAPPVEDIALGAPVDYALPGNPFGATFFGVVLEHAVHPNAAQLLADFMLTPAGQAAISQGNAALLPGIEGTLASMDSVETADISQLTAELVVEFQAEWESWK